MQPAPPRLNVIVPGRFDPTYSLLGRAIRRATDDRRRAASLFVLSVVAAFTVLGVSSAFAALFGAWVPQALALAAVCLITIPGVSPPITIHVDRRITVAQGDRTVDVGFDDSRLRVVDLDLYYTHYRRYRRTVAFEAGLRNDRMLLLLRQGEAPVALDVDRPTRDALVAAHASRALIRTRTTLMPERLAEILPTA